MVSTDALLMNLMIDAWEQRAVGMSDVPGSYLQAYMEAFVILIIVGTSVDVMWKVNME